MTRPARHSQGAGAVVSALLALVILFGAGGPATAQGQRAQEATGDRLVVTDGQSVTMASLPLPQQAGFCLHWFHSVTGGAVADCFRNLTGVLTLESSFLHDYAAGLGDLPGRGRLRALSTGGYIIEDMDEPLSGNRLPLRLAAPHVAQELRGGFGRVPLWPMAAHGARITLQLITDPPAAATPAARALAGPDLPRPIPLPETWTQP